MEIYTIGFTKKAASEFFGALRRAGIKRVVDVRRNNTSQLSGFAKRDDLAFFLAELCGADYVHMPELAPSEDLLEGYRRKEVSWEEYETRYLSALVEARAEDVVDRRLFEVPTVLLCSEPEPDHCHRRLLAEYLGRKWGSVTIRHL